MDSEGRTRCGGEGCDGVVTAASDAWKKAQETEQEIISAMEEVEKLSKMVSLVQSWSALDLTEGLWSHLGFVFRCWRPK